MLCPVCNKTPLTGRKATAKTCSTKCRSALSRQRKKQRDTPHQEVRRTAGTGIAATQRRHRSRSSDTARWEQLLAVATERIVEAVQKHGHSAAPRSLATMRVDMREQVTAQAPKLAAGYRLVLPARHPGDAPKWSPSGGARASHIINESRNGRCASTDTGDCSVCASYDQPRIRHGRSRKRLKRENAATGITDA